jgi:hypothetical protein
MNTLPVNIGLAIVVGSHVYMLAMPMTMNDATSKQIHAGLNIGAAGLIAYGVYY